MKTKNLAFASFSFLIGISLALYSNSFFYLLFLGLFIIFAIHFLFISFLNLRINKRKFRLLNKTLLTFFIIFLVSFSLGFFRAKFEIQKKNPFSDYFSKETVFKGEIIKDIDKRSTHNKITVQVEKADGKNINGKVLISDYSGFDYKYGDKIFFTTKLEEPFETEDFSYKNYLRAKNIFAVAYYPRIRIFSRNNGNFFLAKILEFKGVFIDNLKKILPEPESSLAAGILLGEKKEMPENLQNSFRKTGLTHIVAVSGYNVSLLLFFISGITRFCSRKTKLSAAFLVVILFVFLTGAEASVVRAAMMGLIGYSAVSFGRTNGAFRGLLMAVVVMTAFNPLYLYYDVGFQLSFMATFGIIFLSPVLNQLFYFFPNFLGLRESVVLCFSAQIFVIPVLLVNFDGISLISPLTNLLVAPLIPIGMLISFLSGILALINPYIGIFFGFLSFLLLKPIVLIAYFFSEFRYSFLELEGMNLFLSVFYYLVIFLIIFASKLIQNKKSEEL